MLDDQKDYLSTIAIVKAAVLDPEYASQSAIPELERVLKDFQKLCFFEDTNKGKNTTEPNKNLTKQVANLKNIDSFSGSIKELFNKINED